MDLLNIISPNAELCPDNDVAFQEAKTGVCKLHYGRGRFSGAIKLSDANFDTPELVQACKDMCGKWLKY